MRVAPREIRREGIAGFEAIITAQRIGEPGADGRPLGGAPLSRNHCRRDSLSGWDIVRHMVRVPSLHAEVCGLQPCCRKVLKTASGFGLSLRVVMSAAALVIGAPWSRSSRTIDTCPHIAAEERTFPKSFGGGGGREGVEVHARRIVSTWSRSPSQTAASRDLLRVSGSVGSGEELRERLDKVSGVGVNVDMIIPG